MEALLYKLGISSNQSAETIAEALGAKQMEYLERLDNVDDDMRKAQLQEELKQIEEAIVNVSNGEWQSITGMKRDTISEEAFDDLKQLEHEKKEHLQAESSNNQEWDVYQSVFGEYKEDCQKGFPKLLELAEKGNTYAQYSVGHSYMSGDGVEMDRAKAFEWWLKAAEGGYIQAMYNVGKGYLAGEPGMEKSFDNGIKWLKEAAYEGHLEAVKLVAAFGVRP